MTQVRPKTGKFFYVVGIAKRYGDSYYSEKGFVESTDDAKRYETPDDAQNIVRQLHDIFPLYEQKEIRVRKVEEVITTQVVDYKTDD